MHLTFNVIDVIVLLIGIASVLYMYNDYGMFGTGYIYIYSIIILISFHSQTTTRMAGGSFGRSHSMLDLNQRDRSLLEREPVPSSSSGITAGISTGSVSTAGILTTESRSQCAIPAQRGGRSDSSGRQNKRHGCSNVAGKLW
jgi:hypothetical protein